MRPQTGAFVFAIALFYGINDLDAVLNASGAFPLAEIYIQATGSTGATFGLLFIIFLSLGPCLIGTFLTVGRTWWALARDNATPFSGTFSNVNENLSCPIESTIFTGLMTTAFGAITLGSHAAFSDLVGSFVILTTTSYALAIGGHLFSGRKNLPQGPFWMGKMGYAVNGIAVISIVFFNIIFCFPYSLPVAVPTMNYNSVILAGVTFLATVWWFAHARSKYLGPKLGGFIVTEEGRRLADK
jgi:choline transport protein